MSALTIVPSDAHSHSLSEIDPFDVCLLDEWNMMNMHAYSKPIFFRDTATNQNDTEENYEHTKMLETKQRVPGKTRR